MCVLCGFIGRERQAAHVLLRMGERMQGLWSGTTTAKRHVAAGWQINP